VIYCDTETTGLDPRREAELRIISVSDGTNAAAYDVWDEVQAKQAKDILYGARYDTFVAHNAQFDLDFLAEWGHHHEGPIFDTMVAWQVLHAGERDEKNMHIPARLDYIVQRLFGETLDKQYQKARWDGAVDNQMLAYAAEDAEILVDLHRELEAGLKNYNLDKIFKLEMQLLPILLEAKRTGVTVDVAAAKALIYKCESNAKKLETKLPMIYMDKVPVHAETSTDALFEVPASYKKERMNPRAPQQVAEFFGLPDATEDTLREYVKETGNEHAKTVMAIKKERKKASSVKKQILDRVTGDGRIHTTFRQTFTDTGRLSSTEPNLQNQDRGSDVRGLFVAPIGKRFVIADYSQLELRLAAYYSGDKTMIKAYADGRDLHSETQLRIFGDPDSMSSDERKKTRTLSKNINFGLVYGGGAGVLQRFAAKSGIDISDDEAKEYRDAFREAYPELVWWQRKEGNVDREYIYTHLGRRRYVEKGEYFNARINNKIQGTASDGMKLAMVYLYRNHGILPLLNVHDELLVEADEKEAEGIATILPLVMSDAMYRATGMSRTNPKVPIEAEVDIGTSWSDKH
jgi:DNA polymerase-1